MASLPWAIQGEEKHKFETIFESLGPVNGKLGGDRVKPILLNSKLSTEILGQVWELSDIDKDGQLDKDEFSVAMHLVYKALEREPVPTILPQELIPVSKRKPVLPGAVSVLPPVSLIPQLQKTSPNHNVLVNTASPTISTPVSTKNPPGTLHIKGYIPDIEIQRFSAIFAQKADPEGFIHGVEARGVFVQSQLPQNVLAHVWNVCDQGQIGKLNRDQFILAMHFIAQKVKGVEVPAQIPAEALTPKNRDSGLVDAGNMSDSSSSGIGDFSAVKELDALNREIEELRLEKDTLTREIEEKRRVAQNRSNEVQELQNTLDRASTSLSQLESDKAESHTRIDELDQQQLKLDHMIAHVRSKIDEESRAVATLRSQIKSQELANERQEAECAKSKIELENLKKEESQLRQTLQIGEQQLQSIVKQVTDTEKEMARVKERITSMAEKRKSVTSNIEQYDKAVVALKSEKEAADTLILKMEAEPLSRVNEVSPNPDTAFSPGGDFGKKDSAFSPDGDFGKNDSFNAFGMTAATNDSKESKNEDDMFSTNQEFFASGADASFKTDFDSDPFGGSDPFASPETWSDKPGAGRNSADKFQVAFDDPSPSGLFQDGENAGAKPAAASDPWAAFGAAPDSSASPQNDPFGEDAFSAGASSGFEQAFGSSFGSKSNAGGFDANVFDDEARKQKEIQEQTDYELALKLSKEH